MQLKELLKIGKNQLKPFSRTFSLDVEILVGFVLELNSTELILKTDLELTPNQEKQIFTLIQKRTKSEPIAYLTNKKEFYGLNFYVNHDVLIPRPDTEILVESVLRFLQKSGKCENSFLICDIGTGSGCIPVSLAQNTKKINFVAVDISAKALSVARRNVKKFRQDKRIKLRQSDLLENMENYLKNSKKELVITANLPYVSTKVKLNPEVKNYEPHLALFAGKDGLDFYRKLLKQAEYFQPKAIFLEIDPSQVKILKEISQVLLPNYTTQTKPDLNQKDRVFILQKN